MQGTGTPNQQRRWMPSPDQVNTFMQGAANAAAHASAFVLAINEMRRQAAAHQGPEIMGGSGYSGGYFGGDLEADPAKGLREYEASFSAQAKEDVIRRLARALKRAGINVDPDGDLDTIVEQLVEQIPNPKHGKTFSDEAKAQEKVCNVIADVLNDTFTPGATRASEKFIDTSLSAVEKCRAVGEWAHSFSHGVNTEFLAVHASVKNSLRTIEILSEIMREIYDKIRKKADRDGDTTFTREFDPLNEVYSRAQNERRRQEELLKNILHVQLAPAAKELELAMRDESEQNALIKKLGLKPGTSEFADSLASAVSSLGSTASIAHRVHKALKKVGISVNKYLDSSEFSDFEKLVDNKIESGAIQYSDLASFLDAVDTLRNGFGERRSPKFREELERTESSGHEKKNGGGYRHRHSRFGGDDDDENRSTVDKRVEKSRTEKKTIIRDFVRRMARHYDEVLSAVKQLSPELGKKIPVTARSDLLRDALVRLRDMREDRIELALVGLYSDANARERKERFISSLRLVSATCSELMELEMFRAAGPYLSRLKAAIDSLEKTVDYFSDVVIKKFGGARHLVAYDHDHEHERERQGGDYDELKEGGADDDLLPEIARSSVSLNDAVSEFVYFYYVAKVRENLAQSSVELDSYGEKYVELLGDAVAARLWTLRNERRTVLARLLTEKTAGNAPLNVDATKEDIYAKAKKWIENEYDTKEKFYKALQAMDLYMKAFTSGIVKDPDAVRDVKKMLDGTQVIARWFSEETGDSIWKAFEHMDGIDFAVGRPAGAAALRRTDINAAAPERRNVLVAPGGAAPEHYYNRVQTYINPGGPAARRPGFGIPQFGSLPGGYLANEINKIEEAKKNVDNALDYFQGLKNLVNAFARIGDKFGGSELRSQVFMSPSQIYKTLMDYLKASSMSINHGNGAGMPADITAEIFHGAGEGARNVSGPYAVNFSSIGIAQGNYEIEDRYFVLIVKAMAAKIMTTIGVYDMFERRSPIYALTPTRTIVGGGVEDSDPEVVDGALELYFRLPRLIEFYRSLLRWDGNGADMKISMLPELEGIFSGIIRLVFQKMSSPDTGDYSDSELKTVIREVNLIYNHFREKDGENAVQKALSAFVMEINRRFGLIKGDDMRKYLEMVRKTRNAQWGEYNNTNYAILPGEDDFDVERRAPSDRFTFPDVADPGANLGRQFEGRIPLDPDINAAAARRQLLRQFRTQMETEFEQIRAADFGKTSFSMLIKQAAAEIAHKSGRKEKLDVAMKLIQGTNVVSIDSNKAFMFHETVVVGLNTLGAITTFIDNFETAMQRMDPQKIELAIMDGLHRYISNVGAQLPGFNQAALVGANGMNDDQYNEYIYARGSAEIPGPPANPPVAPLVPGDLLAMRGGIPADVGAGHVFEFIRLEGIYIRAGAGGARRLAAAPSTLNRVDLDDARQRTYDAYKLAARLLINYPKLMVDYIETVFGITHSSGGVIEVRFPQGASSQVQINFSKLQNSVETLLIDVKHYMDLFRSSIPKTTYDRFESLSSTGSVFWIEANLVDRRFRGTSEDAADQARTLDGISRATSKAFANLVRGDLIKLGGAAINNAALNGDNAARFGAIDQIYDDDAAGATTKQETYGTSLSQLLWYDASQANSGFGPVGPAPLADLPGGVPVFTTEYALGTLIATGRPPAPGVPAPLLQNNAGAVNRFMLYLSGRPLTEQRSLLFAFNQILSRYLSVFTDAASSKIYVNLINSLANGVLAQAVTSPAKNSYPDFGPNNAEFGRRGDPKNGIVLLQSLALVLQRLSRDINPSTQIADHLVSTLTDVPLYMKESYRANLPGFIRLFDLIVQKGEFIKQLVQKTTINCARPDLLTITGVGAGVPAVIHVAAGDIVVADATYPENSLQALDEISGAINNDVMKAKIATFIDNVSSAAYTASASATDVLKELSDHPMYLQTQENSIETYKVRYGKLPLMPLSFSLYFLNDIPVDDPKLFPSSSLGDPNFKLQYGVRGLLIRQSAVELDTMPGVKASLEAYNGVSSSRERIDTERYVGFVKNVTSFVRYFVETRNYKGMLHVPTVAGGNLFSSEPLIGAAAGALPIRLWTPPDGNSSYALGKTNQQIVTAVESTNQEEVMKTVVAVTGGINAGITSRKQECILNIIDMNIIPFNVHALMRDIPLANLYNYEFTFDQMVASLYGDQLSRYLNGGGVDDANTLRTREMFIRLLIEPYQAFNPATGIYLYGSDSMDLGSGGFVHRIFRGDNDLGLGRPKFLSDQLFNKALFGSVYQSPANYDEAGPGVGAGISRGRERVGINPANRLDQLINAVNNNIQLIADLLMTHVNAWILRAGLNLAELMIGNNAFDVAFINGCFSAASIAATRLDVNRLKTELKVLIANIREIIQLAGRFPNEFVAADTTLQRLRTVSSDNPVIVPYGPIIPADEDRQSLADISNIIGVPATQQDGLTYLFDVINGYSTAGRQLFANPATGTLNGMRVTMNQVNAAMRRIQAIPFDDMLPAKAVTWVANNSTTISYLRHPEAEAPRNEPVVELNLGLAAEKQILQDIGRLRFDTRFVRNLFFITNVLRVVRLKINRELTHSRNVLVNSHSAVSQSVTEYGSDPFTPNEVYGSTIPGSGLSRFNDRDDF